MIVQVESDLLPEVIGCFATFFNAFTTLYERIYTARTPKDRNRPLIR